MLLQKHLGSELWKVLERRYLSGTFEAAAVHSEVNATIAAVQLQAYVEQLRGELGIGL